MQSKIKPLTVIMVFSCFCLILVIKCKRFYLVLGDIIGQKGDILWGQILKTV